MRKPTQQFVTTVVNDDGFGDHGSELGHALAEPPGNPAAMKGKIGTACALNHRLLIERRRVSRQRKVLQTFLQLKNGRDIRIGEGKAKIILLVAAEIGARDAGDAGAFGQLFGHLHRASA